MFETIAARPLHGPATKMPGRRPVLRAVPQARDLPSLLRQRDPAAIRRYFPMLSWVVDRYFRAEVEGLEHLTDGAALFVGTHNGGTATPDLYALLLAFTRRFGIESPLFGLAHKAVFKIPFFGRFCAQGGAIPASPEAASTVLEAGFPVMVYPGGDIDALKPFSERHRINFAGRRGFVRTALRHQVPIVPVVSVGAHEIFYVLNDGRRMARWLGIDRLLRVKSVPLTLSFPFGLTIAGVPTIPLPSKIRLRVLPPIELLEPAAAADDEAVVERCYQHVVATMQRGLDELAARRRFPVLG